MKTKFYFLILLFVATFGSNAQTWTLMDSLTNSNSVSTNYYDFSVDGTKGIFSGYWIYRTTSDGGATWSANKNIESRGIRVMTIVDGNVVLAGAEYKLFKSTDFGTTWTNVFSANGDIRDIKVVGSQCIAVTSNGEVAYSSNTGDTWTKLTPNPFGNIGAINFVEMLSSTIAYLQGANLKKTTDGGVTWANVTGTVLTGNTFYSTTSGCYSNGTNIFKTTDGGSNWTQITTTGTIPEVVYCLNSTTYYGTRSNENKIYKSTNGGSTWIVDYTSPYSSYNAISGIKFSGTNGYAIVGNGNGGTRWAKITGLNSSVQENNTLEDKVLLYPNPNNGFFEVSLDEKLNETVLVKVLDIAGKEVYSKQINVNGQVLPISVKELTTGMYILDIHAGSKHIVKRFVLN